jgi:circadian clock protein KaiB
MVKKSSSKKLKGVDIEVKVKLGKKPKYLLRLYVTGSTPASLRAIQNIKRICEGHLKGLYDLEVVDIYQRPELAKGEQIIAAPTLIKVLPYPLKRLIGDLSNEDKVILGLDIRPLSSRTKSL